MGTSDQFSKSGINVPRINKVSPWKLSKVFFLIPLEIQIKIVMEMIRSILLRFCFSRISVEASLATRRIISPRFFMESFLGKFLKKCLRQFQESMPRDSPGNGYMSCSGKLSLNLSGNSTRNCSENSLTNFSRNFPYHISTIENLSRISPRIYERISVSISWGIFQKIHRKLSEKFPYWGNTSGIFFYFYREFLKYSKNFSENYAWNAAEKYTCFSPKIFFLGILLFSCFFLCF